MNATTNKKNADPEVERRRWFLSEVHRHDLPLKAWLRGTFPAVSDVEDVVQESYLKIWRAGVERSLVSAKAFLFATARNLALDQLRRQSSSPVLRGDAFYGWEGEDESASTIERLSREERIELLADAIVSLPNRMRQAVVLHKLEDLRQAEVAERMHLTTKTVENLVHRGISKCRHYLERRQRHGF